MHDAIEHSTFRAALICSSRPDNTRCCAEAFAYTQQTGSTHDHSASQAICPPRQPL